MTLSPTERDELFRRFARALFKGDIDALYETVTPDFVWSFHDGLAVKSLTSREAIRAHLAEQKALFSAQRFLDVAYHHADDMTFMTFRVSETVRATGKYASSAASRAIRLGTAGSQPRMFIENRSRPEPAVDRVSIVRNTAKGSDATGGANIWSGNKRGPECLGVRASPPVEVVRYDDRTPCPPL